MTENDKSNCSARQIVLNLLIKMGEQASYSTIVLDNAFREGSLSKQDKAFAAAVFYGVMERRLTLDYCIAAYSSMPMGKLSSVVLQSLRIGMYQLLYMQSVPETAAVNESVKLVKEARQVSAAGFVNAVLRSFIRGGKSLQIKEQDPLAILSITYSCPLWLVQKWVTEYGMEHTQAILASSVGRPPITVRVNTLRTTATELIALLKQEGITAEVHSFLPDCLTLTNTGSIEQTDAYQSGLLHVQDISSQLCCMALAPRQGDIVLDLCSAPGGKAFTLAEMMGNVGRLLAFDLHENRVRMIAQGAKRLGASSIEAQVGDAKSFNAAIPRADRVLCDVPCAGLGVIRRKPEIKYKPAAGLEGLPLVQKQILDNASRYVKPQGLLVYSTCSLSLAENDNVADAFLAAHPEFVGSSLEGLSLGNDARSHKLTLFPNENGGDGFFIAAFRRQ